MISLFRRLRKSLLDSGSFPRYLLYALGEILLVVIGILIALQINNWNEARKNKQIEHKTLLAILDNLEEDASTLEKAIQRFELNLINIERMVDEKLVPIDSLSYVMSRASAYRAFIPITAAFDRSMSSSNFDLIQEDSLAHCIQRLYVFEYQTVDWTHEVLEEIHTRLRYWVELFDATDLKTWDRTKEYYFTKSGFAWNLENVKRLFEDQEVQKTYKNFHLNIGVLLNLYWNLRQENESVREAIKEYLND